MENGDEVNLPKATHAGKLKIGDLTMPCAVLEDGTRVVSERGMIAALGGKRGGSHWKRKKTATSIGATLPIYASAKNLEPFINNELVLALSKPKLYKTKSGAIGHGVDAKLIPEICEIWLKAKDAKALMPQQEHIAIKADILMRGLAKVGIIALVDEATGYQAEREKDALQKLLEAYIAKELLPWTKRFPDEFYKEMFRLRGWQYSPLTVKRPQLVGKITNDIVYERLPNGVLEEIQTKNPPDSKGHRKYRHHQFLTEDIGNPHLEKHLAAVTALMRASSTWDCFKRLLERAYPLENSQLDLFDDEEQLS